MGELTDELDTENLKSGIAVKTGLAVGRERISVLEGVLEVYINYYSTNPRAAEEVSRGFERWLSTQLASAKEDQLNICVDYLEGKYDE